MNASGELQRNWEYELVSLTPYSSDEALLNTSGRVERIKRGEFGLTIGIDLNYVMDETTMIEATAERSNTGDESDYKPIPWTIPLQTHPEFMKEYYNDIVTTNLGPCSNLPAYEDDYTPPFPQGNYLMEKCIPNGDGFPEIAPEGFYRIQIKFTGPVDWGYICIVKVTTKVL
ncbi:uncharacterized protein Dwil_GK22973 [Drosophila willistoni]|uniref:MD-2-related lipid-recognition domain-containing protein n=1 Tax=Drosophila willistoni TaxID=7260 RepID=B4NN17_DROWI|nr:uncharacterized protein Dwil_GK22973 [Drosophila willistoni]